MRSNAREYLEDVGLKRIAKFNLCDYIKAYFEIGDLLDNKESVKIIHKNGIAIQVVDRREQYELRKQKAENIGMGFK